MNEIVISPDGFKQLRADKGISGYRLAQLIESSSVQMWRLDSGRYTTSIRFLQRMIPVFGEEAVANLIVDDEQRERFTESCRKLRRISLL
jgi:predicted transcriptional regulator